MGVLGIRRVLARRSKGEDEGRQTFKMLKDPYFFEKSALLHKEWASLELGAGQNCFRHVQHIDGLPTMLVMHASLVHLPSMFPRGNRSA